MILYRITKYVNGKRQWQRYSRHANSYHAAKSQPWGQFDSRYTLESAVILEDAWKLEEAHGPRKPVDE